MSAPLLVVPCPTCVGSGIISGWDPMADQECRDCNGSGRLHATKTGRLFQYPGGPCCGRMSKAEVAARQAAFDAI